MPDDVVCRLGLLIIDARHAKAMSQEKLSELSNVSVKSISKIEKGIMNPSIEVLSRLVPVLGISLDELLKSEGRNIDTEFEIIRSIYQSCSKKTRHVMLKTMQTLAKELDNVE